MSIKKYFEVAENIQSLANKSAADIGSVVESVGYHEQDIIEEERFIPRIDFSKPENFARYGSAEEYYAQSIKRIYNTYPYDGSLKERLEWVNDSTYLDLYIYDEKYPRTNGYIIISADGWGTLDGSIVDGYGLPTTQEYINIKGGPNPNPDGMSPYHTQFTGSNYYEPSMNRESNLKFDLSNRGATVEFWLKKDTFVTGLTEKEVIFDLWNNELSSSDSYGRVRLELTGATSGEDPIRLTVISGGLGVQEMSLGSPAVIASSIATGMWNHYAVTLKNQPAPLKSVYFDPIYHPSSVADLLTASNAPVWEGLIGGSGASAKAFSVSTWINASDLWKHPSGMARIWIFGSDVNNGRELKLYDTDQLAFGVGPTTNARTTVRIEEDTWYNIVGTFAGGDSSAPRIYINGTDATAVQNATDPPGSITTEGLQIGAQSGVSVTEFTGYMNNLSIWDKELTAAEVTELYNAPTDLGNHSAAANLLSWYPLGSATGDSLDGTNSPSATNKMNDIAGGRDAYAARGSMTPSQITSSSPFPDVPAMGSKLYINGQLENETVTDTSFLALGGLKSINGIADLGGTRANIGSLITSPSGSSAPAYAGKLSASLDEFRFWKTQRTSEQIGLYWFTQVGGGVNTDPEPFIETMESGNVDLGVYFKFNEGITGVAATDSVVLDYSGRFSNGAWTGYTSNSRNTGSAIVLSAAAIKEFKDPIIYSFHPAVIALDESLQLSGSSHDVANNASVYNSVPAWITEQDSEGENNLKYMTQIMSSYFDTLHLQIESLNKLKDKQYPSGSNKPLPFAENLLYAQGFVAPDLFLDADILEKLADRSDKLLFEKSLHDTKNIIYQNIYNNLSYIYKTKGTMKSFRNLIRCFGIDDELVKINMYADNIEYQLQNNRRNVTVADRFVDFNTTISSEATVYNYADPSNTNSIGYLPAVSNLTGGYGVTLEADILFPLKQDEASTAYVNTNVISSSLFGMHNASTSATDTSWPEPDEVNFQVYAVRDELKSTNVRFMLTGTAGGFVPYLTSPLYQEVYNNTRWNLSVRIKPEAYPLAGFVDGTSNNYIVELHGVQADSGEVLEQFTVSQTVTSPPAGFITGSRRAYIGAHRTNFTGTILQSSDIKINACRYWLDYIEDEALTGHALDTENHGALRPHRFAYGFDASASFGDIQKIDTLAFNWEFLTNTGSDAGGQFTVSDLSSGSAAFTRFGALGTILNKQYTASGSFFAPSSTKTFDKDFVVSSKLNLPEQTYSEDMISVATSQEQQVFTSKSRPINYYFAFEKSMYQVISEEVINYFANLKDFHNLIGTPVDAFRTEYKQLKTLRQKFFEKVGNSELDFDKFYEFYKWFDSALSVMLVQLVPASADFTENIITVIENHILERPKYRRKFPFLEKVGGEELETSLLYAASTWADPSPGVTFSGMQPTARQTGQSDQDIANWKDVHAPLPKPGEYLPREDEKLYWHKLDKLPAADDPRFALQKSIRKSYKRRIGSPVKLAVQGAVTYGGVGRHSSNRPNYTFAATAPYGPVVPLTNIPTNIMLGYGSDVEQLIDTTDVFYPSRKQRLGFGMDPGINTVPDERKLDGNVYAPFSLYSSSIETGYNSEVVTQYKSGTMVTNLHNDFVQNHDVPMQGPFAEKFVGGRFYRHTEVNDGTDTRESRAEGFRLELGSLLLPVTGTLGIVPPNYPFADSPSGSAPHGYLPATPTARRFRDETAKRPINIKNILMTTASAGSRLSGTIIHSKIGNYQKNYQVISTGGRTINDPYFQDQSFSFALNPETLATRGKFPLDPTSTENVGGDLNYELPNRTGANSNQTIIVNRFSSPGEYSTLSRGYMEPAHEELSVNNAAPYRNRRVINFGFPGSASLDPSIQNTIRVIDQINKNRGINQLSTLHAGQFGYDSAYGSIATIDQFPSWQKTNKNRVRHIISSSAGYTTGSIYDNLFVQHAIPRSTQQYSWVTGSMISGTAIFGLSKLSCFSASVLTDLVTSGTYASANFVGVNTLTVDPVSASSHILGFPLTSVASSSYYNSTLGLGLNNGADYFNVMINNRGGAFGYSTWKQIRAGESPVARKLRQTNQIGITITPSKIPNIIAGKHVGYIQPTQPNTFVDYFEAPVSKNSSPIYFYFEDNTDESNTANNLVLTVPYRNELDYFSSNGLNNRLGLQIDLDKRRAYSTVIDYTLSSDLSVVVNYSERLYPSAENAYKSIVRGRTEFTITNIWDNSRAARSLTYGGQVGSMGQTIASSSIWPMDGHLSFTATSSVNATDGAGELMNSYSRYSGSDSRITAAPTYAMRIPVGTTASLPVLVGDAEWLAPSQAGKNPYENYTTYAEKIRLIGKDYSIIPEFRISELMDTYVNTKESDFLASLDNIFSLTGAAISNSSESNFYKTYTNADFLRYFSVIDDDLNEQRSGDLKIIRDKVALKCDALIKFLPYKGFYPAERTVELAHLLSQSYGRQLQTTTGPSVRVLVEPMYAPGIMFNTIKSGLAVSNFILSNTASTPTSQLQPGAALPTGQTYTYADTTDNGAIITMTASVPIYAPLNNTNAGHGYVPDKIPFEAIYKPESFFNTLQLRQLPNAGDSENSILYDSATSGSLASISAADTYNSYIDFASFKGGTLYKLAIDNFLCETANIFVDEQVNFQSAREENFKPVISGTMYVMDFKLYRTPTPDDSTELPDASLFTMYNSELAFGTPLVADNTAAGGLTLTHVSPPYYGGPALCRFQYTAQSSGIPTLQEIFSNTQLAYGRDSLYGYQTLTAPSIKDMVMQVDSCFNLMDTMQEVPPGTVVQKDKWLIQSKFETPVLNFASVSSSVPPTSSVVSGDSADDYGIKGMWHQYGVIPTGSSEGVFAVINGASGSSAGSLADIVGFSTGDPVRIGGTKKEYKLEEAIIAIPYREAKNRRNFIRIQNKDKATSTYSKILAAMDKYVFPPKFDFTRFDTVDPILMYIFEFSADLTQQDIADVWQNLPPNLSEKFETKEAVVEEKELIDLILNKDTDTKWMVFKVKKRAKKDFEIVRRQQVQEDTSAMTPNITSKYSYNWPYDYFSLVELAKIDEQVQYVSTDLKQSTRLSENEALGVQRTTNISTTTGRSAPTAELPSSGGRKPGETVTSAAPGQPDTPVGLPYSGGQAPGETNTAAQPSKSSAGKKTATRAVARKSRRNRKGNK